MPIRVIDNRSGASTTVYAMLDTGSDRDVISERIVDELNILTSSKLMTVKTVNSEDTRHRNVADFRLESLDREYVADVEEALVGKLLTSSSDIPPCRRDLSDLPYLQDVQFDEIDADVAFIIGVAHWEAWLGGEVRRGKRRQPLATKTLFGWTLIGRNGKVKSYGFWEKGF